VTTLPGLATPRLALRPCGEADLDALRALWTDPEVRRYLFDGEVVAREQAAAMLAEWDALAPRGLGAWTVRARGEPPLLGCVALLPVSTAAAFAPELAGEVELLAAFAPAAWGRGYAAEALGALVGHAFGVLGLPRLVAVADEPNAASRRMLERVGFVATRTCAGPLHPLHLYALEAPR
jgi:[ribosomal protein S5]-alanine N-acetyltransferase